MDQPNTANALLPTAPGTPFEGGTYVGRIRVGHSDYAIIVAPSASGEHATESSWGPAGVDIPGAISFNDGAANTAAMAAAGSALAQWARGLQINGFADWYLPSRDELELIYRHLKPTQETNYVYRHGENPSSLPAGYPYTSDAPAQTVVETFRSGGGEALSDGGYWSSTQYSAHYAWGQVFVGGGQYYNDKAYEGRARAVRRFLIQ